MTHGSSLIVLVTFAFALFAEASPRPCEIVYNQGFLTEKSEFHIEGAGFLVRMMNFSDAKSAIEKMAELNKEGKCTIEAKECHFDVAVVETTETPFAYYGIRRDDVIIPPMFMDDGKGLHELTKPDLNPVLSLYKEIGYCEK